MLPWVPAMPSASHCLPRGTSRRPIFPKQTALTNSTLAIHVATPTVSWPNNPSTSASPDGPFTAAVPFPRDAITRPCCPCPCPGGGTQAGLMPSNTPVPPIETTVDSRKPGAERSSRYHSAGFASARVSESCIVDCHDNLRMAKATPTKAPIARTTSSQSPEPRILFLRSSCSGTASSSSDAHSLSSQGRASPSSTPAMPHDDKYGHPWRLIPSSLTGAMSCVSCRWLINKPYSTPRANIMTSRPASGRMYRLNPLRCR